MSCIKKIETKKQEIEKQALDKNVDNFEINNVMPNARVQNYLRRQDAKFGLLLSSSFDEDGHFVENIPDESVDVEKVVQTKMMIDALNSALEKLTKEERDLIERICYRDESLRYLAKLKNISHQAMVKRKNKILEKLREFLSDF